MLCCACHTGTLLPTRVDGSGPVGYVCNQCSGALISLAPYLDWARGQGLDKNGGRQQVDASALERGDEGAPDSKKALSCPKCSRIMLRFNVLADKAHGLDYCFHCEEVWLDQGEWDYLKRLGLHACITTISTDTYQRKLREQAAQDALIQRYRSTLGDAVFDEVQRFAQWMDAQPAREAVLRYLTHGPR